MTTPASITVAIACALSLAPAVRGAGSWRDVLENGNRLMAENRYAEAAEAFREAAASAAGNAEQTGISLDHQGVAYAMLGRDQEAERCYKQSIMLLESSQASPYPYLTRAWMDSAAL